MLAALYDLASRKGLLEDPDFEVRRIHYAIRLDRRGRVLTLQPMDTERPVPRVPKRASNVAPAFLTDNAKYVLGLGKEGSKKGRNQKCLEAFRAGIASLAEETSDDGAVAVLRFYESWDESVSQITAQRPEAEWTGGEQLAFLLDGDGERLVHEREAIRACWSRKRRGEEAGLAIRCLVTGDVAPVARMHDSIKRVPQAQSSGASLVSFNAPAFCSQGLEQGQNAPVSRAAAEGYVTALNWLLDETPSRRHRYGVRLGSDAVTVFWTREENPVADLFASFFDPSEEDAVALAESPLKGLEIEDRDVTPFYAVTLSGNAARVVVRDWFEATAAEVKKNVRGFFEDLRIGGGDAGPVPIWKLLRSVETPSGQGLSPELEARLFRSALQNESFPRELLGAALRRLRLPPDAKNERQLLRLRCSLIKATLLRMLRGGARTTEVTVSLDEKSIRVPYLLGRLFAVLERQQAAALQDLNATIRDRYFGVASSAPALVFSRLLRLSMHHASKAEGSGWLEKLKGQIIAALPSEPFPRSLSLEDQGLFAIGYYHQREKFFTKTESPEA